MSLHHILAILTAFFCGLLEVSGLELAHQGRTAYVIVLPDSSIMAEQTGADELAAHLKAMTGAAFPIVREAQYQGGPMIAVGFNARLPEPLQEKHFPKLGVEELVIAASGDTLLLGGGRPRGSLYAVYEFLESLGIRWYTPKDTFIPKRPELSVEVKPLRYQSPFYSRSHVPGNGEDAQWAARNRVNSLNMFGNPGEKYGSGVLEGPGEETFYIYLSKEDMEAHPEWHAEINGRREATAMSNSWGVCLSNPDLRALLVERALGWARKNPTATAVWLAQNDGSPCCTCEKCRAFYAAHGNQPSSLIVQLLNELAEKVGKEFPAMHVKTLAYSWSLNPPENMKLADNVTVMFCAGIDHRATLGRDPQGEKLIANFQKWKQVASDFEVFLYGYPHPNYYAPCPCYYSQARNIQWAAQNGIRSIHHEIFGFSQTEGGALVYLTIWVYTRLMWNPALDIQQLTEDFCNSYYGEGAPAILQAIREYNQNSNVGIFPETHPQLPFLPNYVEVPLARKLCTELERVYDTLKDPVIKDRFAYAMLPMLWADYWGAFPTLCQYDPRQHVWGAHVQDPERIARHGRMIRQIMIANHVTELGERNLFNPREFHLEELAHDYPAFELANSELQAVAVPGCYGKLVTFRNQQDGFQVIKPAYGDVIMRYPQAGCWSDTYNGRFADSMKVIASTPTSLAMQTDRDDGVIQKTFTLEGDTLRQDWRFQPAKSGPCQMQIAPLLDCGPQGFGIYPTLRIGLKAGGWRDTVLGKASFFWYQCAAISLDDFNGKIELVSEDGRHTLEFSADPAQLSALSYMYDRYDGAVAEMSRVLELYFQTQNAEAAAGSACEFHLSMRFVKPDK